MLNLCCFYHSLVFQHIIYICMYLSLCADYTGHFLYPGGSAVLCCTVHFKVSHLKKKICLRLNVTWMCLHLKRTLKNVQVLHFMVHKTVVAYWLFFFFFWSFSLDKALHSAGMSSGFIIFGTNLTNPLNELLLALQPVSIHSCHMYETQSSSVKMHLIKYFTLSFSYGWCPIFIVHTVWFEVIKSWISKKKKCW